MAACLRPSRLSRATPAKSRWTARRTLRCAPRIRLSPCLRNSAALTSNCATLTSTIFRLSFLTSKSEDRAQTGPGESAPRDFCSHFYFRARAASVLAMKDSVAHPPLVAIVGPTASGKSALGVWLAERLGGEVVACDSTQLYRGFDIGTAKPSLSERRGIPHHLIDILGPEEEATAGGYRQLALAVLDDLRRRNRVPVLTVGTGLY